MTTVFLWCAIAGGAVLVLQLLAGLVGLEDMHAPDAGGHEHGAGEGLSLLGIRSVAAGVAFFGIAGLAARPLGGVMAAVAALAAGGAAMIGVAAIVRAFSRLEQDRTLSLASAIGTTGTVYLSIPARRAGAGKVHVTVNGRLTECAAVTADEPLPTGASVLVIDLEANDTLVVVRNPILLNEASNVGA